MSDASGHMVPLFHNGSEYRFYGEFEDDEGAVASASLYAALHAVFPAFKGTLVTLRGVSILKNVYNKNPAADIRDGLLLFTAFETYGMRIMNFSFSAVLVSDPFEMDPADALIVPFVIKTGEAVLGANLIREIENMKITKKKSFKLLQLTRDASYNKIRVQVTPDRVFEKFNLERFIVEYNT